MAGSQTTGANGNVLFIDLAGGIRICFSGLDWFYTDSYPVQRQSDRIDMEMPITLASRIAGRDESSDKAIQPLTGTTVRCEDASLPKRKPEGRPTVPDAEG